MTRTIKSFTSNAHYFCPNRKGGCKHMQSFNAQMTKTTRFAELWHALDYRSEAQRVARREAYCVDFMIYG